MKSNGVRVVFCFLVISGAVGGRAAGSSLGVATANGDFQVNGATVRGNATILDGSVIQTAAAPSRVHLARGPEIQLGANSRAKLWQTKMVLESGVSDLRAAGDYEIEAGAFRIALGSPETAARVVRKGMRIVEVTAIKGSLRVYGANGLQLANILAGTALSLDPQAGAGAPSNFLGCLLKKKDKFIVYDQTTRLIIELRGSQDFAAEWGNRVQVIGATDTSARSDVGAQVVDVTTLTRFAEGGCEPVAGTIAAQLPGGVSPETAGTTAPAPSRAPAPVPTGGGGMSAGTKVVILAAAGGGAAAGVVAATSSGGNRSQD